MEQELLEVQTDDKTAVNVLILLANLAVLGLALKLYTELFKDKAFDKRAGR
jgi:hypothetical protein